MKVLLCGAEGQIGSHIAEYASRYGIEVRAASRKMLDICQPREVQSELRRHRPAAVVNAAAFTDVDGSEGSPAEAFAANAGGPRNLARGCAEGDAALIHLSTDYVFDGRQDRPYREDDPPQPLGIYGQSKWQGEQAIRETLAKHLILRTSWVVSHRGRNFVRTILERAKREGTLSVVDDQTGCPTPAADVADVVLQLLLRTDGACPWGTYHYCGAPETTWHGLSAVLLDEARRAGYPVRGTLVPIETADRPAVAARPRYSVLDCGRIATTFGISRPNWRPAVENIVRHICAE